MTPEIPADLKAQFRSFINSRTGLYFKDYDLRDLSKALGSRMAANRLDSPTAYYNLLAASEKKEEEVRELLNLLTVNHTYFFRNEPQFAALKDKILPELLEKKRRKSAAAQERGAGEGKPSLRIWSAGCSTGEEPYTIAMVLCDLGLDPAQWDLTILATDASSQALDKARIGLYGKNSLRPVDQEHLARYFTPRPDKGEGIYQIDDNIKKMVEFGFFNLMEENYPIGFDLIFCRNVVIYFELPTTIRVMRKFYDSLQDDGYMFIGYSESLAYVTEKFRMEDWQEAIFYRKVLPGSVTPATYSVTPAKAGVQNDLEAALARITAAEMLAEEKRARQIAAATGGKTEEETAGGGAGAWAGGVGQELGSEPVRGLLPAIIRAVYAKQYDQALELIDQAHKLNRFSVEPYYYAAEILANQGQFRKARAELDTLIMMNPMFAPAYYLLGSVLQEENRPAEAKQAFRKSLYIDKDFPPAHFSLAAIYKNDGQLEQAIREYRNTLNTLANNRSSDTIPYSGGFTAAALAGVCQSSIERLKYGQTE